MATKEEFNHYQPLGNSDPAHTAIAPGGLHNVKCGYGAGVKCSDMASV